MKWYLRNGFCVVMSAIVLTGWGAYNTAVNTQVPDAVTQSNVKVLGESPAMAMGIVYQTLSHSTGIQYASIANQLTSQCVSKTTPNAFDCNCILNKISGCSELTAQAANCVANPNLGVVAIYKLDTEE